MTTPTLTDDERTIYDADTGRVLAEYDTPEEARRDLPRQRMRYVSPARKRLMAYLWLGGAIGRAMRSE